MKTFKSALGYFLVLILLLFFFNSCQNSKNRKNLLNKGGTLNVKIFSPVETLDPNKILYLSDVLASRLIYDGLVGDSKDNAGVAEKWEISKDGLRYVFHLKKGILFHSDPCFKSDKERELTASDVLFTFKRIADRKNPSVNFSLFADKIKGIRDFQQGLTDSISGIKIRNKFSIEFILNKPYVVFLKLLASPSAFILSETAVNYYGNEIAEHPIGTGPFKLSSWNPTEEVYFIRNKNYRRKNKNGKSLPFLEAVSFKFFSNEKEKIGDLFKGKCDYISLDRDEYNSLKNELDTTKFKIIKTQNALEIRFFGFSFEKNTPLAKNPELRKALAYSLNRQKLYVSSEFKYFPQNTLAPASLLGDSTLRWYQFNPVKSKALAGNFSNDNNIYELSSSVNAPFLNIIESGMKSLNLKVARNVNPKRYYERIIKNRPDIFRISMSPSFPDLSEYYQLFYSKSGKYVNLFNYQNPEFDKIFEKSQVENNPAERRRLFRRLEKILRDDVAAIYVSEKKYFFNIVRKRVKDFTINNGFPDFALIRLDK